MAKFHVHRMKIRLGPLVRNGQHVADVYKCTACTQRGIKLTSLGETLDKESPVIERLLHLVRPGGETKLERYG